jgi:hypothetical protein
LLTRGYGFILNKPGCYRNRAYPFIRSSIHQERKRKAIAYRNFLAAASGGRFPCPEAHISAGIFEAFRIQIGIGIAIGIGF